MLLLVTILLVLVAAVTLLIGIFSDELALIFISIGASALAAIVLAVLSQMSRKKGRATAADQTPPEPLPARQEVAADAAASIEEIGEPVTRAVPTQVADASEAPTETVPAVRGAAALPIENYDALRVNEILPQLQGLDLDELEAVAQHEESRKNRTTVLNRIDALMDELEAEEAGTGTTTAVASDDGIPATEVTDEMAEEVAASIEEIGEPVVAIEEEAEAAPAASDGFPIPNYDQLSEAELIPLLEDLDADQLEAVADREEAGPNRDAVLDAIDDRLDILEGIVPAPAAAAPAAAPAAEAPDVLPVEVAAPAAAPAKRSPAKKAAAAKKAPAKKAGARSVTAAATAPAKKATTAAAKKAAPAKATKKALEPAKKATAATAKRTVKAAPTVKKAAAVAKAPAKKATAAKKATKR